MEPAGTLRLSIHCGETNAVAVLVWPDGHWTPLMVDGTAHLPSSVYVDADGTLLAGPQAWQHATACPERFVLAPLRHLRDGRLVIGSREVDPVDLVAAPLRRVGEEAARVVGGPVTDVRLVVPASWGPRRRTLMRQAAHRAGLGQPILVEAPVAAAEHLLATGIRMLVGEFIAVCELGSGCEASVLRRTPGGFDVLATIDDPDAGDLRVEELLVDRVAALTVASTASAALTDGERLMLRANLRTAVEALAHSVSVAVALPPPQPAVVLDSAQLESVARPVLAQAARTVRQVIDAAEISTDQVTGVYCIGSGASTPAAVLVLAEETGLSPVVVDNPPLAAVLGAGQANSPTAGDDTAATAALPPLRRAVALLVPGLASLALVCHFILTAEPYRTRSRGFYDPSAYVVANWGELAMAATFALVACLAAATLIASTLRRREPTVIATGTSAGGQITTALVAAVALGLAVAGMYAVGASVYFELPNSPFMRWALVPVLPIAAVVTVAAVLAARWDKTPTEGWHGWLNFPAGSVVCAAAGMLLVQVSLTARAYPSHALAVGLLGRAGGLLLGVGVGVAVVARPLHRLILAAPLAVFAAAIVSWPATGMLGVIYIAAGTVWWLQRVWQLIRGPDLRRPQPLAPAEP